MSALKSVLDNVDEDDRIITTSVVFDTDPSTKARELFVCCMA